MPESSSPELEDEHEQTDEREDDAKGLLHDPGRQVIPQPTSDRAAYERAWNAPSRHFPNGLRVQRVNGRTDGRPLDLDASQGQKGSAC